MKICDSCKKILELEELIEVEMRYPNPERQTLTIKKIDLCHNCAEIMYQQYTKGKRKVTSK